MYPQPFRYFSSYMFSDRDTPNGFFPLRAEEAFSPHQTPRRCIMTQSKQTTRFALLFLLYFLGASFALSMAEPLQRLPYPA